MLPASNNRYWSCPQSASISEILWDALRFTRSRISPATNRFFFCIFGALLEMLFWDSFRFLEPVKPSPSHGFNLFLSSSFLSWFCLALKLCFLFQVLLGMLSRWFTDLTRLIETSAVSLSPSYAPSDFQGFFEMMLGGGEGGGGFFGARQNTSLSIAPFPSYLFFVIIIMIIISIGFLVMASRFSIDFPGLIRVSMFDGLKIEGFEKLMLFFFLPFFSSLASLHAPTRNPCNIPLLN